MDAAVHENDKECFKRQAQNIECTQKINNPSKHRPIDSYFLRLETRLENGTPASFLFSLIALEQYLVAFRFACARKPKEAIYFASPESTD